MRCGAINPCSTYSESIRVLHVDDEPEFLTLTKAFLTDADDRLHVESAASATEALDTLDAQYFDCILSDFDMPGMDGLSFLSTVRESYPAIPFMLFTGSSPTKLIGEAIDDDVTDIIQKSTGSETYRLIAHRIHYEASQYRAIGSVWCRPEFGTNRLEENKAIDREQAVSVCQSVTALPAFTSSWIGMVHADTQSLVPIAMVADDPQYANSMHDQPIDISASYEIAQILDGSSDELVSTETDPIVDQQDHHEDESNRTVLLPLYADNSVWGLLGVTCRHRDALQTSERDVLASIGTLLSDQVSLTGTARDGEHMEVII